MHVHLLCSETAGVSREIMSRAEPDLSISTSREPECTAAGADVLLVRLPLAGWAAEGLLERLRAVAPGTPVVVWTARAKTTEAVGYAKLGAFQTITDDLDWSEILETVRSAAASRQPRGIEATEVDEPWRRRLIGNSWPMQVIGHMIRLVAAKRATVLVTGETGTGKEVVARALHEASPRAPFPFVPVNCTAIPQELLEAELFGHVKGAFTGAFSHRIGRFEQAHRGTLFLDEIGDMPMSLQAKLLRVLQEREFQRVGSSETVRVDIRIVAASNANLAEKIRRAEFREDLYYRLRVVPIQMPALRQRRDDIPVLVEHFIQKICRLEGLQPKSVAGDVVERLAKYDWPGNVRELENTIEMAVAMSGDRTVLQMSDFPLLVSGLERHESPMETAVVPGTGLDFEAAVDQFERRMLEQALLSSRGNKTMAAELLNLKRTTFLAKLRSLGIAGGLSDELGDVQRAPSGTADSASGTDSLPDYGYATA